ncbi:hypothetical protein [Aliamphritea hakodatensis]|uniref:hypothetical protein n=1 Tax=Aliamphritea hakodatensis TaxID=2895352 RepID=UPI0022FD5132|nr:hypothetical protein [Aliamphritea hakodatensis]
MKILGAVVAVCLALFLFYQAHGMPGLSLERLGYIAGAVILIVVSIIVFVPPREDQ